MTLLQAPTSWPPFASLHLQATKAISLQIFSSHGLSFLIHFRSTYNQPTCTTPARLQQQQDSFTVLFMQNPRTMHPLQLRRSRRPPFGPVVRDRTLCYACTVASTLCLHQPHQTATMPSPMHAIIMLQAYIFLESTDIYRKRYLVFAFGA